MTTKTVSKAAATVRREAEERVNRAREAVQQLYRENKTYPPPVITELVRALMVQSDAARNPRVKGK